jgi:hypothetical protein
VRFGSAFWLYQFLLLALKLALSAKVRQVSRRPIAAMPAL